MAQQLINVGTVPNDETGDTFRASFVKCNDNFTEIYAEKVTGPASSTDNALARFHETGGKTLQDSLVTVSDTGVLSVPAGSTAAPSINFGTTSTGMYSRSANFLNVAISNKVIADFSTVAVAFFGPIAIGETGATTGNFCKLYAEGNYVFGQRTTTNPQTYRLYNTWTDASNYERLAFTWDSNTAKIQTEAAGTGTLRDLSIGSTGGKLAFLGAAPVVRQAHVADADTAHALNATFSDTEVEGALNALAGKINSILATLEAFGLHATS